jgi:hypothetical protein
MVGNDMNRFATERNSDKRLAELAANVATQNGLSAQGTVARRFC